jgi:hypothetical protein
MAWLIVDNFFGYGADANAEHSWAVANATPIVVASAICVLARNWAGVVCIFDISPNIKEVPQTTDWLLLGVAILAIELAVPHDCFDWGGLTLTA